MSSANGVTSRGTHRSDSINPSSDDQSCVFGAPSRWTGDFGSTGGNPAWNPPGVSMATIPRTDGCLGQLTPSEKGEAVRRGAERAPEGGGTAEFSLYFRGSGGGISIDQCIIPID